ncbi:hypothetical protein [Streptobacillus felis]|uniref:hypothetical protein n=1 Tax=Streptobacillus felis TaxID=1384509 RepID=UPI000A7E6F1E|nr:hypothetical protein [Streptobacillus felis]
MFLADILILSFDIILSLFVKSPSTLTFRLSVFISSILACVFDSNVKSFEVILLTPIPDFVATIFTTSPCIEPIMSALSLIPSSPA